MTYDDLSREWASDREFVVCHTSGSTGNPKEIRLPKIFMEESAMRTIRRFSLTHNSHLHSCISPDFIGGKMMWVRSHLLNCRFTFETPSNRPLSGFSPADTLDFVAIVPSQLLYICENYRDMPRVGCYLVGGAPVNKSLRAMVDSLGINAYESYGMTETSSHIAVRKISSEETPFHALGGITVSDNDGCLEISIPGNPPIRTNDTANILSENEFFILGRRDNIIISGGKKLQPEIIEDIIRNVTGLKACVVGMPDEKWGEKAVCLLEAETEVVTNRVSETSTKVAGETEAAADTVTAGETELAIEIADLLRKSLKEIEAELPSYMRPKEYIAVRSLPVTPSGKLLHTKLTPSALQSLSILSRLDPKSL